MSKAREFGYWWRAALVSTIATGLELVLVHFLSKIVAPWILYATVQILANLVTFLAYKYWAFGAGERGSMTAQYVKQAVVFGGSYLLNLGIPSLLHYKLHLDPTLAFALSAAGTYVTWNYPLNRFWVFRGAVAKVDDGHSRRLSSPDAGPREGQH